MRREWKRLGFGVVLWCSAWAPLLGQEVLEYRQVTVPETSNPSEALRTAGLRLEVGDGNVMLSFLAVAPEDASVTVLPQRYFYWGERQMVLRLDEDQGTMTQIDRDILGVLALHLDQQDTDLRVRLLQLPDAPRRVMADVLEEEEKARQAAKYRPWDLHSSGTRQHLEEPSLKDYRSLRYDAFDGDQLIAEVWFAEVDQTPLDETTVTILQEASTVFDQLLLAASDLVSTDAESVLGIDHNPLAAFAFRRGVPVKIRRFIAGEPKYEKILQTVRARHRDDPAVKVPTGYRPKALHPQ